MSLKRIFPVWPIFAALLVTLMAMAAGRERELPASGLLGAALGIFLLLWGYFALADERFQKLLTQWCQISRARTFALAGCLVLPYLAYSLPLHCFSLTGFSALLAYVSLPILAVQSRGAKGASAATDFAALLLIWLPVELGALPGLWLWPPGQSGHFLDGLLGVVLAVYCFQVVRALPGIGYRLMPRSRDWLLAGAGSLMFLPVALGLGAWTGFFRFSPHVSSAAAVLARILGIFLITGIPEELLFRGLLQNLLLRWTGRPIFSLALASILFGLAHLNVGSHPDWRLVLLATLAGAMYGWLYQRSGSLMAPALAHTLVNSLWTFLFRS